LACAWAPLAKVRQAVTVTIAIRIIFIFNFLIWSHHACLLQMRCGLHFNFAPVPAMPATEKCH
jgi:hypothetical protein